MNRPLEVETMELFWIVVIVIAVVFFVQRGKARKRRQEERVLKTEALVKELENDENPVTFRVSFGNSSVYEEAPTEAETLSESEACWVRPGEVVTVHGYTISDGMLYVGEKLRSAQGGIDAALIDPSKPVSMKLIDRAGINMGYWPSYSDISASSRAAYLEWLAGGRRAPDAYIGYVFLFLYGLERRLLVAATKIDAAKSEIPQLLKEVEELISVYGDSSGSFRGYAKNLIDAVALTSSAQHYTQLTPPLSRDGWDYPIQFKVAVGAMVMEAKPIPPEWALSWVRCFPEANLRTPATRCVDEFSELFKVRYNEQYPEGLKVKPNKTRLKVSYRPASPSLSEVKLNIPDLPDVTQLQGPINQLMKIAESVQDELDSYSRLLGQGVERGSIPALALLPAEVQGESLSNDVKALLDTVESAVTGDRAGTIDSAVLIGIYPAKTPSQLTKKEAALLLQFLGSRGYGIEPDVRHGGINLTKSDRCVVFRLEGPDELPSSSFSSASILLQLGVAMANADGDVSLDEQKHLLEHMKHALQLSDSERRRLSAHMRWLLDSPPTLSGMKTLVSNLEEGHRHTVGQFMISLAAADGHISPSEIKILSKVYPLIGLDPDAVYRDVHALSIGDGEPVTVLKKDGASKSFAIPKRADSTFDKTNGSIELDPDRLAKIREQSKEAAALLTSVFTDESDRQENNVDTLVVGDQPNTERRLPGLDVKHTEIVRIVCERLHWSRADFDILARRHDLLPGGALETINEASFDFCGEALLEGDDPLEVNQNAKAEIQG